MNKCLLSILLASWSLVITNAGHCDTGSAAEGQVLSVQRSSLANADVAILKEYNARNLSECLDDCCDGKFGLCTVASFTESPTVETNCFHFNCRPLHNCKFLSSTGTNSFTFPGPLVHVAFTTTIITTTSVPSNKTTITTSTPRTFTSSDQSSVSVTKEEIATFSEEQFDLKNDNTTIKPRKGVEENEVIRSGVKPRKGVSLEDFNFFSRSKVKPRKGVEPYSTVATPTASTTSSSMEPSSADIYDISPTSTTDHFEHMQQSVVSDNGSVTDELLADLKMVFEDDPLDNLSTSNVGQQDDVTLPLLKGTSHTATRYSTSLSFIDHNSPSTAVSTSSVTISGYHPSNSVVSSSGAFFSHIDTVSQTPILDPSETKLLQNTEYSTSSSGIKPSDSSTIHSPLTTISVLATSCDKSITLTSIDGHSSDLRTSDMSAYSTSSEMSSHSLSSEMSFRSSSSEMSSHSSSSDISASTTSSVTSGFGTVTQSTLSTPRVLVQSYQIKNKNDEESEKERRYKSSMHLVLSLVFGLLVLFAVLGVVARRVYDGWMRRHYRRMDFLIDGMYHGYE